MSDTREQPKRLKLIGGALCLDFANTAKLLNDYGDLLAWARRTEALEANQADRLRRCAESAPDRARTAFGVAVSLRQAIHRVFSAQARGETPTGKDLTLLSNVVGRSAKHLELQTSSQGWTWGWHDVEDRLDLPLWIVARSAADLLTSDLLGRVGKCADPGCGWLFIDTSRNRSRRWCDMADCGNRAKARRDYARRRGASPPAE